MRYSDAFRDSAACPALLGALREAVRPLAAAGRRIQVMEVCGTHTMAIGRHGLRRLLPAEIKLISGPGCPVCVTDSGYLDAAIALGRRGAALATFGDLLHVPASDGHTLSQWRSAGEDVRTTYSPLEALEAARAQPDRPVVFLAIGFETTIAPILSTLVRARAEGLRNLSLLVAFKRVLPAMSAVLDSPGAAIDGFLCPPHVSTVIGSEAYRAIADRYGRPCVVAGFEPTDILEALVALTRRIVRGEAGVENRYARVVTPGGNRRAQALIEEFLEPADAVWRGFGRLPNSGFRLRAVHAEFDAERRFGLDVRPGGEPAGCRCGDVVAGRLDPPDCPLFARRCTPFRPVGPCMVSSEGSCAAWYKYDRMSGEVT